MPTILVLSRGVYIGDPLLQHDNHLVDELSGMGCAGSRILPCWVTDFS
jgi:hypothetical protein